METTENNLEHNQLLSDTMLTESYSTTLATGTSSIASSHSHGISFENSTGQQQANYQIGLAKLAKANSDLLTKRIRVKGNRLALKNSLAASLLRLNKL